MKKKIAVIVVAVILCVAAAVFAVPKISFYACEPTVYFLMLSTATRLTLRCLPKMPKP